jgi:uncharacterized Zn-binding protein involved in type VI secretion
MPFRSEKQRRYLWANEPKIAREWTEEYGSKPVKAKIGKYQDLKHPEHDIKPVEHMEDKVSSKERVERLLDERKSKKDTKKKLAKDGQGYVPGWKPNLSVKAAEGELIRQKTRGTGAAVKGTEHYTMKGMPTAYQGQLIQAPTRGTGAAVKGTDHYVMPGMDAAKEGKMIKAKKGYSITTGLKGYDVKKISKPTSERLFSLYRHRERGGFKQAKDYQKYLKNLKGMTTKATLPTLATKSKSFYFQDIPKPSKLSTVLKKVGKRTGIGKALLAGTAVAGAYEAGKRKLFTKDKKKKTIDKKSIGGETVVMKSGGGYIDDLL